MQRITLVLVAACIVGSLAACSGSTPPPPPVPENAGTLLVHAYFASGAIDPHHQKTGVPMKNAHIIVRRTDGSTRTATANAHGVARFALAPGVYQAQLVDADCPRDTTTASGKVRVSAQHLIGVTVLCWWGIG